VHEIAWRSGFDCLIRFFVQRPIFHLIPEGDTLMKNNPRRNMLILTMLLLVIGLFAAPSHVRAVGTIYYVNCATGSDSNNGLSTSTPWRTTTTAHQQTQPARARI